MANATEKLEREKSQLQETIANALRKQSIAIQVCGETTSVAGTRLAQIEKELDGIRRAALGKAAEDLAAKMRESPGGKLSPDFCRTFSRISAASSFFNNFRRLLELKDGRWNLPLTDPDASSGILFYLAWFPFHYEEFPKEVLVALHAKEALLCTEAATAIAQGSAAYGRMNPRYWSILRHAIESGRYATKDCQFALNELHQRERTF